MVEESYEEPQKTIKKVQKGLDELKKRAEKKKSISSDTFLKSLKDLTKSMNDLSSLFKEASKDIIQEVFLRIFKNIKSFNGKCRISTWIYRITLNESLKYLAKNLKIGLESYDFINEYPSKETSALKTILLEEQKKLMNIYII